MKKLSSLFLAAALLLLLLAAARAGHAQAAITLTQATFPAAPGAAEYYQDATTAGVGPAMPGANRSWDYRNLTASGSPYTIPYQPVPAGSGISGAQWTRPRTAVFGGLGYYYTAFDGRGATGSTLLLGRTVARQATPLAAITGASTDSLVINRQTVVYNGTAGVVNMTLPLTTGGYANRSLRFGVTGTLTAQILGYNKTPLRIVQRYQFVDSVAGWGTLRVPVAGQAGGSPALAVLMLRSRTIRQDSFYLNGTAAPAAVLAGFGVTQGQVTRTYYDNFWRTGSVQPLAELFYPNSQYSAPYAADYSTEPTLLATRPAARASAGFVVWPNPARAGQPVQLALAAAPAGQLLHLTVRDALGRAVAQGAAVPGQPTSLLQGLPAGLYLLEADTPDGSAVRRVAVE